MQNILSQTGLIVAAALISANYASAQLFDQTFGTPVFEAPAPSSPPMATVVQPAFKWDYRFDAQYNSTIKPYLRWYNRAGNRAPVNGVRYPYYLGPQPYYGGGVSGGGCDACGQTGYGYVQPQQSSWFNPYSHMSQSVPTNGQPISTGGDLQAVLQYLSHNKSETDAISPTPASQKKTAWVKLEVPSQSASILYSEPAESVRDGFVQALVTTTKGKLTSIEWVEEPSEQLTTVFAKYVE